METIVARKNEQWLSNLIWVLLSTLLCLFVAKVFFANQLATTGAVSSSHSFEVKLLKAKNQKLQNEVSLLGSLGLIGGRADKIGLKKSPKLEVLPGNSNVALRQ